MFSKQVFNRISVLVIVLLVASVAFASGLALSANSSAQAAEPAQSGVQQWEFLKVDFSTEAFMALMNGEYEDMDAASLAINQRLLELGGEGWELVDVEYYETGYGGNLTVNEVFFFKRPLQ